MDLPLGIAWQDSGQARSVRQLIERAEVAILADAATGALEAQAHLAAFGRQLFILGQTPNAPSLETVAWRSTMTVNTKQVAERREIRFESLDDLLADAEKLASGEVRTVGNWTLGQILEHLAQAMISSIDGTDMKFPWLMKKIIRLFVNKDKMLNKTVPAGFKIPKKGEPQFSPSPDVSTEDGLASLRAAVQRCQTEEARAEHPVFGELSREQWDKFQLRHAELHLSFAIPV